MVWNFYFFGPPIDDGKNQQNTYINKFLVFNGNGYQVNNTSIVVNGTELSNITSADRLGHRVSTMDKACLEADALCKFWKSNNLSMTDFRHIKTSVKCKLFKTYCCSFYGGALLPLHSNGTCVFWHKVLIRVFPIPHINILLS